MKGILPNPRSLLTNSRKSLAKDRHDFHTDMYSCRWPEGQVRGREDDGDHGCVGGSDGDYTISVLWNRRPPEALRLGRQDNPTERKRKRIGGPLSCPGHVVFASVDVVSTASDVSPPWSHAQPKRFVSSGQRR